MPGDPMAIYFRCSACGGEHRCRLIQMDRASFEEPSNRFENNSEPCPVTGAQASYSKPDMLWKDEN
jgi:hypothetical protein